MHLPFSQSYSRDVERARDVEVDDRWPAIDKDILHLSPGHVPCLSRFNMTSSNGNRMFVPKRVHVRRSLSRGLVRPVETLGSKAIRCHPRSLDGEHVTSLMLEPLGGRKPVENPSKHDGVLAMLETTNYPLSTIVVEKFPMQESKLDLSL